MIVVDEKLGLKEKVSSVKEQLQEGNFKNMVLKSGDVEVGTLYLIYLDFSESTPTSRNDAGIAQWVGGGWIAYFSSNFSSEDWIK